MTVTNGELIAHYRELASERRAEIDRLRAENAALKEEVERSWLWGENARHAIIRTLKLKLESQKEVDDLACLYEALYGRKEKSSVYLLNESRKQLHEIAELRAEIARKDEALRWYADNDNYSWVGRNVAPVIFDGGQQAREAL